MALTMAAIRVHTYSAEDAEQMRTFAAHFAAQGTGLPTLPYTLTDEDVEALKAKRHAEEQKGSSCVPVF